MSTHRTGRPVADAALDWAERGGGEVPPELDHYPDRDLQVLLDVATKALADGVWEPHDPGPYDTTPTA